MSMSTLAAPAWKQSSGPNDCDVISHVAKKLSCTGGGLAGATTVPPPEPHPAIRAADRIEPTASERAVFTCASSAGSGALPAPTRKRIQRGRLEVTAACDERDERAEQDGNRGERAGRSAAD